eukprot:TRINITY_DN5384_c7_g1_i1.p1 TRINITY_DN5384_c7_g1~~TRINITY_DN5384_c7_g1_i1.p1  ORF type:complete len:184 (+),score=36.62 TRINITY_DN5384_c7_g1_i1:58-609(+)
MPNRNKEERASFENDVLGGSRKVINDITTNDLLHDEYTKTLRMVEEMERKRRLPPFSSSSKNATDVHQMDEDALLTRIRTSQQETARCKAILSQKLLEREYEARQQLLHSKKTYNDAVTASAYLAAPLPHHPETYSNPSIYHSQPFSGVDSHQPDHYRHQVKTPMMPTTSPRGKKVTKYPVFW